MKLLFFFFTYTIGMAQNVSIRNLSIVNSAAREANPYINPQRTQLYFMSTRGGESWNTERYTKYKGQYHYDGDLYISQRVDGEWAVPKNLEPPINTRRAEDEPQIGANSNQLFYESWNIGWKKSGGPYYTFDFEEKERRALHPGITQFFIENDFHATDGACISVYEDLLFFAAGKTLDSNMDIYFINLKDENAEVQSAWFNTSGNERTPFIASDNKTLYFSSDQYESLGQLDIFKTEWKSNTPQKIYPLDAPVNSKQEDRNFTISASGDWAYCIKDEDIYEIDFKHAPNDVKPTKTPLLSGFVTDCETKQDLTSEVYLFNNKELKLSIQNSHFTFPVTDRIDQIFVDAKGYESALIQQIKTDTLHICLNREKPLIFYFEFDQYQLSEDEKSKILVSTLPPFNGSYIFIGSADAKGSDAYNLLLSEKRIQAVQKLTNLTTNIYTFPWGEKYASQVQRAEDRKVVIKKVKVIGDNP